MRTVSASQASLTREQLEKMTPVETNARWAETYRQAVANPASIAAWLDGRLGAERFRASELENGMLLDAGQRGRDAKRHGLAWALLEQVVVVLARPAGLEPTAFCSGGRRSIH